MPIKLIGDTGDLRLPRTVCTLSLEDACRTPVTMSLVAPSTVVMIPPRPKRWRAVWAAQGYSRAHIRLNSPDDVMRIYVRHSDMALDFPAVLT